MAQSRRTSLPGKPLLRPVDASDLMLATKRRQPFDDDEWLFELKLDGYRCLASKTGTAATLLSREGNRLTGSFPDVTAAFATARGDVVVDSELTVDDERGHQQFELLQRRSRMSIPRRVRYAAAAHPARLYVFDLLAIDGRDLRGLPLLERKRLLREVFDDSATLVFVNGIVGHGCAAFEQVVALDLEGLVAKRLDSRYQRGRSKDWLKIKNPSYHRQAALGFGSHWR